MVLWPKVTFASAARLRCGLYRPGTRPSVTGSLPSMECAVTECSSIGLSPFECAKSALADGRIDSFKRHLRAEGLEIDYDPKPGIGASLLFEALKEGEDKAVLELLARGARVDIDKTKVKLSPLHLAVKPDSGISDETVRQMLLR